MVGWLKFNVPFQHKYGYIRRKVQDGDKLMVLTTDDWSASNHTIHRNSVDILSALKFNTAKTIIINKNP